MRNWFVLTGGPNAGMTSITTALEKLGFHVEHESARQIIDEGIATGRTLAEIRANEQDFQDAVYVHKLMREARLDPDELIIFDRGMQDTEAYYALHGFTLLPEMRAVMQGALYRRVFLLEPYTYVTDYARTETAEEQHRLTGLLEDAYRLRGVPITRVPTFPSIDERIEHVIGLLKAEGVTW